MSETECVRESGEGGAVRCGWSEAWLTSCTSPKTEACFSATVTSSLRRASVMVPHALNIVLSTERSSGSAIFADSTSSKES